MAGLLKAIVDLVPEGIIQLSTPVSKIDWVSVQVVVDGVIYVDNELIFCCYCYYLAENLSCLAVAYI